MQEMTVRVTQKVAFPLWLGFFIAFRFRGPEYTWNMASIARLTRSPSWLHHFTMWPWGKLLNLSMTSLESIPTKCQLFLFLDGTLEFVLCSGTLRLPNISRQCPSMMLKSYFSWHWPHIPAILNTCYFPEFVTGLWVSLGLYVWCFLCWKTLCSLLTKWTLHHWKHFFLDAIVDYLHAMYCHLSVYSPLILDGWMVGWLRSLCIPSLLLSLN